MTKQFPPLSYRHPAALMSPLYRLSDGRVVAEFDYATAATFNHPETQAALEAYSGVGKGTLGEFDKHRRAVASAVIPDSVRAEASELARGLAEDISVSRPRWKSGQIAGRVDGRAFVRLVDDARLGRLSDATTRPYRAKVTVDRMDPPRFAIVADYCWDLRGNNGAYERRVGTVATALLFACEAADLPCTFACVRGDFGGQLNGPDGGKCSSIAVISKPGRPITAAAYRAACGGGEGGPFIYAHVYASWLANQWNGGKDGYKTVPGSSNGAGGIRWAREVEGATFVIGIGSFPNGEDQEADLILPANTSPREAVRLVRERFALKQAAA